MLAAITTTQAILIGVAAGLFVVAVAVAVLSARAGRAARPPTVPGPDIPPGMKPGPSDADLEKPLLERLQGWAVVLMLFLALWMPYVWLREPGSNEADAERLNSLSVDRGELTTEPGTEENQLGFNCERCHGPDLRGGLNVYNGLVVQVPNLQTVCGGAAFGHPQIESLQDVIDTIAMGRSGTDMPSWSVRFAGAMDDQQIQDLVNYIVSIQKVPKDQNVCLTATTAGAAATPSPAGGAASPSPTPGGGTSPSPVTESPGGG